MPLPIDQILDLARWAPSGDNTQPWRFELVGESSIAVHGVDTSRTRADCVYDLDGHPTQISIGAMIETLAIAASGFGLRAEGSRRPSPDGRDDMEPVFDIELVADSTLQPSALIDAIPRRSVQRRRFSTRALTPQEKQTLEASLPPGYHARWFEGAATRFRLAKLMFHSAKIRLTIEEAYRVHKAIIAWGCRYSADRVPDQSLGADPLALKFMRWAMHDWQRVELLNRFAAGTWLPRLQMDFLPGLLSGAHVALVCDRAPVSIDDYVAAGRCVQRFWLTATLLGLQKQPEITPLIFARFARDGRAFSQAPHALPLAREVAARAASLIGHDLPQVVWLARIGHAPPAASRSQRRSRTELILPPGDNRSSLTAHPAATP